MLEWDLDDFCAEGRSEKIPSVGSACTVPLLRGERRREGALESVKKRETCLEYRHGSAVSRCRRRRTEGKASGDVGMKTEVQRVSARVFGAGHLRQVACWREPNWGEAGYYK